MPRAKSPGAHRAHVLLLYASENERFRLLQPYLQACDRRTDFLSVLSADPAKDKKRLSRSVETLVADARVLMKSGSDSLQNFIGLFDDARDRFISGGFDEWLWIGDWAHLCYGSFGRVMGAERNINQHKELTVVCCFRNRGLPSLPLPDLAELFRIHDVVVFPSTTFVS